MHSTDPDGTVRQLVADALAAQLAAHTLTDPDDATLLGQAMAALLADMGLLRDPATAYGPLGLATVATGVGLLVHLLDPAGPPLGTGGSRSLCGRCPVHGAPGEVSCNSCANRAGPRTVNS